MILYVLVITITLCFCYNYFTRTFNYWKSKNVKGPKPIPFFGNFKNIALRRQHVGILYSDLYKQFPDEKVVGLYRMTSPTLLIRDLDIVKQVLIKDFEAFPDRATYYSKEGLGENMFHSDIDTWKILRHRFTSVFTSSKFKSMFPLLADRGDKFNNYIEYVILKKPEQDIYQLILKYTVSTVMVAVFGLNIDTFTESNRLFEIIDDKLKTSYYNEVDMLLPGFLMKCNLSMLADETIKFCHQIVEAGIKQLSVRNTDINNVMDVIMNLRKEGDIYNGKEDKESKKEEFISVTDDLLAAQAWVFYTAGYANNTLSLTYALYYLARNPAVQEKLREEIDEVMERFEGKLTYAALKEMKYLDMVFQETLRLHPLTNGLVRSVSKDIKIEGIDLEIEKGSVVVVSPYAIQRDEKYFSDPEKFYPERFLPENVKDRHPCAFIPFGLGQRSCLGSQLARIQFGICIAKLLSKFHVEPTENTISSINYDPWRMLLTPKEKIVLKFVKRTK